MVGSMLLPFGGDGKIAVLSGIHINTPPPKSPPTTSSPSGSRFMATMVSSWRGVHQNERGRNDRQRVLRRYMYDTIVPSPIPRPRYKPTCSRVPPMRRTVVAMGINRR
mmetsp:Transcript_6756/g.13171  ORF Transcript_6756/g.13171 Transcript_6756/m.13171 type:complete len:108 (+) Transcript_6756:604-927(+)